MYYTTAIVELKGTRAGTWLQLHIGSDKEEVRRLQGYSKGILLDHAQGASIVHNWLQEMQLHKAEYVLAYVN